MSMMMKLCDELCVVCALHSFPRAVGLPEEGASVFYPLHGRTLFLHRSARSADLPVPRTDGTHRQNGNSLLLIITTMIINNRSTLLVLRFLCLLKSECWRHVTTFAAVRVVFFLCRSVLFVSMLANWLAGKTTTLTRDIFHVEGFPYKDQIEEFFIVMVYCMFSQHNTQHCQLRY